ncbi:MAG: helix-turn-helix transcriptional regulator [Clostridia bacterium]|nr:helix-turn-helix transcriptional regulator [Clostridia bacterium]
MDNIQTGRLIAELRKKQGLTQQQLADKLNLSNKTISKWESGSGSPDISNLPVLAEALEISVDELLNGELNQLQSDTNVNVSKDCSPRKELTPEQKKERAIIALAASVGAILGILAYNFGWLG